jgi:hypothetical protein
MLMQVDLVFNMVTGLIVVAKRGPCETKEAVLTVPPIIDLGVIRGAGPQTPVSTGLLAVMEVLFINPPDRAEILRTVEVGELAVKPESLRTLAFPIWAAGNIELRLGNVVRLYQRHDPEDSTRNLDKMSAHFEQRLVLFDLIDEYACFWNASMRHSKLCM